MDATVEDGALYPLMERTLNYIVAIDKDTEEDQIRLQQMLDIDNDLQSLIDARQEEQERWEEDNMDGQEGFARDQMKTIQDQWNEKGRHAEGRERQERRQEQTRARHEGSESARRERYQALHQMVITGRCSRLEAAQREAVRGNGQDAKRRPKAPPAGIQPPLRMTSQTTSTSSTQQLRDNAQRNEERQRLNAGGYYVTPPGPNYQRDKERGTTT
eukprot:1417899-Amphidinium_carterae.3